MDSVNRIFRELAATPGKNAKVAILNREYNNALFRESLRLMLDTMTQYHVRKIPLFVSRPKPEATLHEVFDSGLPLLSSRTYTGNAAIAHLKEMLESLSPDDAEVLVRIIKKDPACGVQTSTVNKVWAGLITIYPVMLASAYDEKLIANLEFPALAELKADGKRFNAIVRDAQKNPQVEYRARSGKEMFLKAPKLDQDFIDLALSVGYDEVVFDGELIVLDENHWALPRTVGNGIINKASESNGTISDAEGDTIGAIIWDYIPLQNFVKGIWNIPYDTRRADMLSAQDALGGPACGAITGLQRVSVVESTTVNDLEEAQVVFNSYLEQGLEGIILKSKTMIWEAKRSKKQVKFKGELTCDLVVVGWQEGRDRHAGRMGALICETSDGKIRVHVGGGYTDAQREEFTRKKMLGQIIEVLYNVKVTNSSGGWSLFLPRFVQVRDDKDVADAFENVA